MGEVFVLPSPVILRMVASGKNIPPFFDKKCMDSVKRKL